MRGLTLIVLLSSTLSCTWGKSSLAKKVLVDVNGQQLTAEKFSGELAFRLRDQDALSAKDPKLVKVMKDKIVEEFIVQSLTEDWARQNSLVVKAEELESQIQSIVKNYPDDLTFQQSLVDEGTTFKEWRERVKATLLQKAVSAKILTGAAPPTDQDIETYYKEHREQFVVRASAQVRQILVATESDAKTIEKALKSGKSMASLAQKYSISPEASQGGMVGWVEKGLSDVFESAFRMARGARSPILKSSFGYHIFEVTNQRPSKNRSLPEVKDEIKRILMEKKEQSLYLAWLEEQVRKSRVFKDDAFIENLRVETKSE